MKITIEIDSADIKRFEAALNKLPASTITEIMAHASVVLETLVKKPKAKAARYTSASPKKKVPYAGAKRN